MTKRIAKLENFKRMCLKAREIANLVRKRSEVLVVTHVDADGITSGAIAVQALRKSGIESRIEFVKQLDEKAIEKIADENVFVWFTDLGSGQIDLIEKVGIDCIVTDHHQPIKKVEYQLNPHDFGIDGSYEFGGAPTTYLVSRCLFKDLTLSALAIVGCVGDLQDSKAGMLKSFNRVVLGEGIKAGVLEKIRDIRLFGKQTRPVYKMLEFTFDPYLPGISGNEEGALNFMKKAGVEPVVSDKWRRWIDLSKEEKVKLTSELVKLLMRCEYPIKTIERLVGEVYILKNVEEGTELRDAMEFSTLLNATARYGYEEVGLNVCLGVCKSISEEKFYRAYKRAKNLLQNHRKNLSEGVKFVSEKGIEELENVQYFHAGKKIKDTIVGIVAGMCYSLTKTSKPIVAFAESEEGVKVSARATQSLVDRGINLAEAVRIAAERVGGKGGGHNIAAGATIPEGREREFLTEFNRIIGRQLRK